MKRKAESIKRYILSLVIGVVLVYCFQSLGLALTNEPAFSQFQFNFITPGARATAMGGAFIGLADDATAVESNPAGLTILAAPELSLEFKHLNYTTKQMYANRSFETEIIRKEFDDYVESISFASVVYPYQRVVFALYRQEAVNYKSSYRTGRMPIKVPGIRTGIYPTDASVEFTVTNYGFGAAVPLLENLSLAISPRWSELYMKAHSGYFGINTFPGPTNFSEDDVAGRTEIDDHAIEFSINAGVLWKPHPKISVGAVYRSGPTFKTAATFSLEHDPAKQEFILNVPESFGAGVAVRATDFLTLTLDVVHIRYEDLLTDFSILGAEWEIATKDNYTVNNATEVHLGLEYLLPLGDRLLALRAGMYTDPDHTIRFTGTTGDPIRDIIQREEFPGGEDQFHITGGVGLVVNEHFQVDTAANFADNMKQLSISAVYRF